MEPFNQVGEILTTQEQGEIISSKKFFIIQESIESKAQVVENSDLKGKEATT